MKARMLMLGLGLVMALMALAPGVARADAYPNGGGNTPQVPASPNQSGASAQTAQANDPSSSSGGLPFTGADIAGMSVVALGALGAGTVLVYRSRRSSAA
jgi:hypothetical protein